MSTPIVKCGTKVGMYEMNKNKKTTIEVKGAAIKAHLLQDLLTGKVRVTELFKEKAKEAAVS